jgi:pilus assembly protein CpaE
MAIKILLADDCAETRRSLRTLIELESMFEVIGEAENGLVAVEKSMKLQPDLVIMDVNMPLMNGIEATEKISVHCPKTAVLICSVQGEMDYLRKAMMAGAKDYLVKPISTDQLIDAVTNISSLEKQRQLKAKSVFLEDHLMKRSHKVALVSAKGGVGKTTIAVNLATMAAQMSKQVCLVDLDLQFGDSSMMMSLSNVRYNIFRLVQEAEQFDQETVSRYLLQHESGVKVLAAPLKPEEGEYVSVDHVREILATLGEMFELVVVDTAPLTNDLFFAVMELCDQIGMVSTPSLPILKNNHNLLTLLETLEVDGSKLRMLLNRCYSKTGVKQRDVIDVLGRDLFWELPNDFQFVDSSVNEGVPFVWKEPSHRLSKQIELLVQQLLGLEKRRQAPVKAKPMQRLRNLFA